MKVKSTYKMTETEICREYRTAKKPGLQLQVLAELNGVKKLEIIRILVKNGEKLPQYAIRQLYKRLDFLEQQIAEEEREYSDIAQALKAIKE